MSEKTIIGVLTFLGGAIFTHLWMRFRNRLITLSWTAEITRVAQSSEGGFGRITVLYNDVPVKHLHLVVLTVRNESATDLSDIRLMFGFREGSVLLLSTGQLVGDMSGLLLAPKFFDDWRAAQDSQDSVGLAYFGSHRDYTIPVLNRDAVTRFEIFVAREDDARPDLSVSCTHKGVRLRNRPPAPLFLGVSVARAAITGIVISCLIVLGLTQISMNSTLLSLSAWGIGLIASFVGALSVRLGRVIFRLLG
jgi:hypothetical protein